jgi:hypothetical protein
MTNFSVPEYEDILKAVRRDIAGFDDNDVETFT